MDPTARALESETIKWLEKLKEELAKPGIREAINSIKESKEKTVRSSLKNMNAYIEDCRHFLEKKDFIRAFEAVVYAWGIWETLKHLGLIENKSNKS